MIEERVHNIVKDVLGVTDVNNDQQIEKDLGVDSLDQVELLIAIEKEFEIEISDAEAEGVKTVGDMVKKVQEKCGE